MINLKNNDHKVLKFLMKMKQCTKYILIQRIKKKILLILCNLWQLYISRCLRYKRVNFLFQFVKIYKNVSHMLLKLCLNNVKPDIFYDYFKFFNNCQI